MWQSVSCANCQPLISQLFISIFIIFFLHDIRVRKVFSNSVNCNLNDYYNLLFACYSKTHSPCSLVLKYQYDVILIHITIQLIREPFNIKLLKGGNLRTKLCEKKITQIKSFLRGKISSFRKFAATVLDTVMSQGAHTLQ